MRLWGLFSPFSVNEARLCHHGRSPRCCHACYGIDKTRTDINTVAVFQSDYTAWPASIPASPAALHWRPCIHWIPETCQATFRSTPSPGLALHAPTTSVSLPSTPRSTHHISSIQAQGQGASLGALEPWAKIKPFSELDPKSSSSQWITLAIDITKHTQDWSWAKKGSLWVLTNAELFFVCVCACVVEVFCVKCVVLSGSFLWKLCLGYWYSNTNVVGNCHQSPTKCWYFLFYHLLWQVTKPWSKMVYSTLTSTLVLYLCSRRICSCLVCDWQIWRCSLTNSVTEGAIKWTHACMYVHMHEPTNQWNYRVNIETAVNIEVVLPSTRWSRGPQTLLMTSQ